MNVLVALAWRNHVHHGRAHAWFRQQGAGGWATCPLTQSAFVRVSSNARVIAEAKTPREAIALLRRIVELPGHRFWHDDVSIATSEELAADRIVGYRQVTDAHLVALALRRAGRVATFDRGLTGLVPAQADPAEVVELIP